MQIAADTKPLSREIQRKMEQYRGELLAFGMREPSKRTSSVWNWYFFKPMTELTAFVVNLTGTDQAIKIVYGYASTAFTRLAGCENALMESGVADEDITIRERVIICNEADEEIAKQQIAEMHSRYLQTTKDELLAFTKVKRKEFVQQIAVKLKPLGFKKKANTWTRPLEGAYYLIFDLQKSAFSDEYYFNVYIGKNGTNDSEECFYTRVAPQGMYPMDWQALSKEEFELFLDNAVLPLLTEIINAPLKELGKRFSYWVHCSCDRKKCESCWVEKNRWDLIKQSIYHLPVETPEGAVELEVEHKVIPIDDQNVRVTLSAMVQGVLHSYESDSTEKNLLSLAKNLPEGWHMKSCISCRYGHFCPVGDQDNTLFCVTDFEPKAPRDLWHVTEDENERRNRSRTLFDCCDRYQEQCEDYFTYGDYYHTIHLNGKN